MNKQEFANKIQGNISVGECIVAPFGDSSTVLIVDRDSYYENMRMSGEEDFEDYEGAEGYCSEACFLRLRYDSLSDSEKELFDAFYDAMRSGRRLAECPRTSIAWRTRSDLDRDLELFLETK